MTESSTTKVAKNPEVTQKAARRRFTGEYKRRIALEAESCSQPGEIGAFSGNTADPTTFTAQVTKVRKDLASRAWCWSAIAG